MSSTLRGSTEEVVLGCTLGFELFKNNICFAFDQGKLRFSHKGTNRAGDTHSLRAFKGRREKLFELSNQCNSFVWQEYEFRLRRKGIQVRLASKSPSSSVMFAMLLGTYDKASSLSILKGGLRRIILSHIFSFLLGSAIDDKCQYPCKLVGTSYFPPPNPDVEVSVNMMPFVLGTKESLPESLQKWWALIEQCPLPIETIGQIGYLTVQESWVEAGKTQRRAGLHTECPAPRLASQAVCERQSRVYNGWGGGVVYNNVFTGGIFMMSNISDTTTIWNVSLEILPTWQTIMAK